MTELIVAMDSNGGIGFNHTLPWRNRSELAVFRRKTLSKTLVVGRRTRDTLPPLDGRDIVCLTRRKIVCSNRSCDESLARSSQTPHQYKLMSRLSDIETGCCIGSILDITTFANWQTTTMIAGGAQVYELALATRAGGEPLVKTVHMSVMEGDYECDTYFNTRWLDDFVIVTTEPGDGFVHHTLKRTANGERQYLSLVQSILVDGKVREGRNGRTLSKFKSDFVFDLRNGFPLLTTRKMFLRGIVEEFIFFVTGQTDSNALLEKKVRIWEGNTTVEFLSDRGLAYAPGVMGPMYGYQWRHYNAPYNVDPSGRPLEPVGGVDQLANVIELIKTDPRSRRILMTVYNPCQAEEGVLYPCHSITIQFYVDDNYLDMFCYNRSQDVALGVPFNIASSSLLLMTVSELTSKIPRFLYMTMGDAHIYEQHTAEITAQLARIPYELPTVTIPPLESLDDLTTLKASDFVLSSYVFHPPIKMAMVA